MKLLAGDVGGTHVRLAAVVLDEGRLRIVESAVRPADPAHDLAASTADLVSSWGPFDGGCLGVPGPVEGDLVKTTNLPWVLSARELARAFGIPGLRLVNDLVAHLRGLDEIPEGATVTIHAGRPDRSAPRAVIAPGTGLGVALGVVANGVPVPVPSEAGHAGFAPQEPEEFDLARKLAERHGRASWERVVSGPGLEELDALLAGVERSAGRSAERITRGALEEGDERARRALGVFCRALARFAGDVALGVRARGGVFLSGGIPPRILPRLREPDVVIAYTAKGRLSELVRTCPFHVVLDETVGLLGAARVAAEGLP